jgi:hypothetical protein
MQLPRNNKDIEAMRDAVERVRVGRVLFWFFAINLPIALLLSALIGWHNSVVGSPTSVHLLMRGAVVMFAFAVSGTVFVFKVRSLARKE